MARIVLCLILLHLCHTEAINHYVFDDSHAVASILLHYADTVYLALWLFAKANLIHLGELLDIKVLEVLSLTEEALSEFISKLSDATEHPLLLVKVFGGQITANELLELLHEATLYVENSERMLNQQILECFPLLLQNPETQVEAAKLFWALTLQTGIRDRVSKEAPLLYKIVEDASCQSNILPEPKDILCYLLASLKGPKTEGITILVVVNTH